ATMGKVSVGGIDVKDYDIKVLREAVSVVLQKNVLFSGTIKENLKWGNENATDKEIEHVCKLACADIAYTKGFDGMSIPEGSEYCTNLLYEDYNSQYTTIDEEQIISCIDAAKAEDPDVIISLVHWGSVYKMDISESQQKIADLMFENGVDVILGSHSHMVAPIEMREVERPDGTMKQGFLAYSLGNFLSSDQETNTQESLVLNLTFTKNEETGSVGISDVNYAPLYIVDNGKRADDRYEILDIYRSIDLYNTSYLDRVSDEIFEELNQAIETLKTNTNTDYDRGPTAE
ncbi:MAG: CapA family protein, partial [Oscillospiraceae bacterium]|nr:CapA family protein [Oscillospiraceae bacterium]